MDRPKPTSEELAARARYMREYRHADKVEKIKKKWSDAFSKLSADEQASLNNQEFEIAFFHWWVEQGHALDQAYLEMKKYLETHPLVESFIPLDLVGHKSFDLGALDDRNFAQYGKRTRLPRILWLNFLSQLIRWSEDRDCDPQLLAEAKKFVADRDAEINRRLGISPEPRIQPDDGSVLKCELSEEIQTEINSVQRDMIRSPFQES